MASECFPESNSNVKGKIYGGGNVTSIHKVRSYDSNVRAIVKSPT